MMTPASDNWLRRSAKTRQAGRRRAAAIRAAAPGVLRESGNPAVMWGDCGLLDMIGRAADPALADMHPLTRHELVLDALRYSRDLVPGLTVVGRARVVRIYWLPEQAPAWAKAAALEGHGIASKEPAGG